MNIMAESLIEIEKKDANKTSLLKEAINTLEKAYNASLEQTKTDETMESVQRELDLKLKRARKILYLKRQSSLNVKKSEVRKYIEDLIELHEKDTNKKKEYLDLFTELKKEKENNILKEIPDYLNCKISYVFLYTH